MPPQWARCRTPASDIARREVRHLVRYGASPRGLLSMIAVARVQALIDGRINVAFEDLSEVAAGEAVILVPSEREAGQLSRYTRWPFVILGE